MENAREGFAFLAVILEGDLLLSCDKAELDTYIAKLEAKMRESAKKFEFERAATLRDQIKDL